MPKLSSLVIEKPALMSCLTDNKLCCYLNEMIKILDITHHDGNDYLFMNSLEDRYDIFMNSNQVNKFCTVFSNIEQLQCCIYEEDVFLFILNHLPKLKTIEIKNVSYFSRNRSPWLKTNASKLNINCTFV
jgi:hypothetical protein